MTTENAIVQVGVDISKAKLDICLSSDEQLVINNTLAAIKKWLSGISEPIELAMEATGIFHLTIQRQLSWPVSVN